MRSLVRAGSGAPRLARGPVAGRAGRREGRSLYGAGRFRGRVGAVRRRSEAGRHGRGPRAGPRHAPAPPDAAQGPWPAAWTPRPRPPQRRCAACRCWKSASRRCVISRASPSASTPGPVRALLRGAGIPVLGGRERAGGGLSRRMTGGRCACCSRTPTPGARPGRGGRRRTSRCRLCCRPPAAPPCRRPTAPPGATAPACCRPPRASGARRALVAHAVYRLEGQAHPPRAGSGAAALRGGRGGGGRGAAHRGPGRGNGGRASARALRPRRRRGSRKAGSAPTWWRPMRRRSPSRRRRRWAGSATSSR